MYTVFLAGGVGSGKSTVAKELELLGVSRIDLDQLSRDVLTAGSPVTKEIAEAFGKDLLDPATGELNRRLLATRAFSTPDHAAQLEAIELPAIKALLLRKLDDLATREDPPLMCVVEIPLLDRMADDLSMADEVLVVCCPMEVRRERAIQRGMEGRDFDARVANQPSDKWLRAHATHVIENDGTHAELRQKVRDWYDERVGGRLP
ncbi:MAG: dephospho-CoA kinase [Atopobiaceae bacterium]|nr:dephospho-CoA kinase [Atopobiaceae bacterium]